MKIIAIALLFIFRLFPTDDDSESYNHELINYITAIADYFEPKPSGQIANDGVTRFFVIGDFGTLANYPGLKHSSMIMENLATEKNYSHIITAGDNFYIHGIPNMKNLVHPWLIMQVFKRDYIGQLKIYPTLGNHDCYVNYENEIKFTQHDDQWDFYHDYYDLVTPLMDGSSKNFVNLMLNSCKLMCSDSKWTSKSR